MGLVREILLSHVLGASWVSDVFLVAFKFPNFFRRFFAEGAFSAAFIPELSQTLQEQSKNDAINLVQQVAMILGGVLLILVLVVEIFTPYLTFVLAPGFTDNPQQLDLAIQLIRLTFPYVFLICMASLWASVLNSLHYFGWAATAPILLNIFMIGALLLPISEPVYGLGWSILLAGITQLGFLYYLCYQKGFRIKFCYPSFSPQIKNILKRMGPGMIGASAMQINILIDQTLASLLPVGSLTYLYYADRFNQLPLSILGIAISTVLLPTLVKAIYEKNQEKINTHQNKACLIAIELSIPASFGLAVLSYEIVSLFYGHGKFTQVDISNTVPALAAYALGLPAYVLSKVYTTIFFANKDTKTPVMVAFCGIGVNLILNLGLIYWFAHVGLALATSIAAWVGLGLLRYQLQKKNLLCDLKKHQTKQIMIRCLLGGIMATTIVFMRPLYFSPQKSIAHEILNLSIGVVLGLIVYGIAYALYLRYSKTIPRWWSKD